MRPPHLIRREILRLRDVEKLTTVTICERSRVSRTEIINCFKMQATEETLRRLDAFLDAKKLHVRPRAQTLLAHDYEKLSRELWRWFKMPTVTPATFERWDHHRQKKYVNGITSVANKLWQRKLLDEHAIVVKVPDGATYWNFKARCVHRLRGEKAIRTGDRDSRRVPWPRPVRIE